MEEVESRFLHLLQPIRDLTRNWEVDVAAQLGEYLEELDQICISFDNGKTTMNFIEAALLIQGSACIYSRKVEHLYLLVYQTLDFISNKKRQKQPCSVRPDGTDADATFRMQEEEFLSLDDIPETTEGSVDLRRDHHPTAVDIVPLTPMALVPAEEAEKRDNPLLSQRGELLASRKDFRMNTSTPHTSGAFLLEVAALSPVCRVPGAMPLGVPGRESLGTAQGAVQVLSFSEHAGALEPADDDSRGDEVPGDLGEDVPMTLGTKEHVEAQRGYVLRERGPARDPPAQIKVELDPWQSLDPFSDSEEKPLRKGRPFLVPHGLDDAMGGKRKRKGPGKLQDFVKWFSASYSSSSGEGRRARRRAPTFADLELLFWKQLKERMAAQRKLQGQVRPPWLPQEEEEEEEEEEAVLPKERGMDYDGAADDFMEHEELSPDALEELAEEDLGPPPPALDSLGYEDLVCRNVELFMASSQPYARETELSQHLQRWEERMGPLLQEQESRAPFDIRSYGQWVVGGCGGLGSWCSFASLMAGQPPFEVCRYALATLQLANDRVVELCAGAGPGAVPVPDSLRLRLLSLGQPHERFLSFVPPSARP